MVEENCNNDTDKYVRIICSDNVPVQIKNRAIFCLRNMDTDNAALALTKCISGKSVLLDHEIAYVLGQMKRKCTTDFLLSVAKDSKNNAIVRHEAIEALGNFEDKSLINNLQEFLEADIELVKESAILAIDKLKQTEGTKKVSTFGSRDPAYPCQQSDINILKDMLTNGSLVEKYQAMFKLRDINTKETVEVLAEGFKDNSDLLRHEVAYVFGQMENEHSIDALTAVLENESEVDVVRHEAAEALGAIGTEKCKKLLEKFKDSKIQIVKESVDVGLEILDKDIEEYLNI